MSALSATAQEFFGAVATGDNVEGEFKTVTYRKKEKKENDEKKIQKPRAPASAPVRNPVQKAYVAPEDRVWNGVHPLILTETMFRVANGEYSLFGPGDLFQFTKAKLFASYGDFQAANKHEEKWVFQGPKWQVLVDHVSSVTGGKVALGKTTIPVGEGKWSQVFFIVLQSRAMQTIATTKQTEIDQYAHLLVANIAKSEKLTKEVERRKKTLTKYGGVADKVALCNKMRAELGKLNPELFALNKLIAQQTRTIVDLIHGHAVSMLEKVSSFTDDWAGAIQKCGALAKERVTILNRTEKSGAKAQATTEVGATEDLVDDEQDEQSYSEDGDGSDESEAEAEAEAEDV